MHRPLLVAIALGALAAPLLAAEAPDADAKAARAEAEKVFRQRLKEVRLTEIRYLRGRDPADFREGREKILAMTDEAVVGPLVLVLYGPNPRYRSLLIEALQHHAERGSKAARVYLQDIAVGDGTRGNRRRAVRALHSATGPSKPNRLMAHLALDEVPVLRARAAEALAALQDKRAVWLLVERLVTEEYRLSGAEVTDYNMQFDIRFQVAEVVRFRQAEITAAAPLAPLATTTIDLPEVEVIDLATTVAMSDRRVRPEYKRVIVKHPAILAALRRLTGKDFGYDQAAWQRWLDSDPKGIPPWEPIRLSGNGHAGAEPEE